MWTVKSSLVGVLAIGLMAEGLADTLVLAPGNGVTTNVTEVIGGVTDVQINDAATGGGIVKLAARNTYRGTTTVKSGTLEVSSIGSVSQTGSMGAPTTATGAIRLGNGTLRYTGAGETTDRALVLAPDASIAARPGILEVTNPEATLTFVEPYTISGNTGHFIKTGPGTLAFTHQTPGLYRFAAGSQNNNNFIDFKTNGDSPTQGFRAFVVANGTVVFDNPMTVTNYFASEVQPGALTTTTPGGETGGRLVFRNGGQVCDGWLSVACICGTDVTNPDYARAGILDVEGGYVQVQNLGLAYCHSGDWDNARPHGIINLSGGTLRATNNLRIDHTRSWGTINVTGGLLQIDGPVNVAHYTRGAQFDLNVQGPGCFVAASIDLNREGTTKGATSSKRTTVTTIRLTDGAAFECGTMKSSYPAFSSATLHADGAALTMKGNWSDLSLLIGATAPTLTLTRDSTLAAPISLDEGVSASTPLVVSGAYQLTCTKPVRLPGGISSEVATLAFADLAETPVTLGASATLRTTASPVSIPALVMGAEGRLTIGFSGTTPAKVTCESWTAPTSSLVVELCTGATTTPFATAGTYDLLTFPASVDFDVSKVVLRNGKSGSAYTFDLVTSGATKTLRVTIASDAGSAWTSNTYDTRLYTFAGNGVSNNTFVINGAKNRACGFEVLGDTTFTRGATGTQGAFMKLGAGTLTLAGPYEYVFGKSESHTFLDKTTLDLDWFAEDGSSRLNYNPFSVANGRLVVGAPGQRFTSAGEFWVGTATTLEAGKETTGEFVFNGGEGKIGSYLCVGRNNGYILNGVDTRPNGEPLCAKFIMNGGTLQVGGLIYGYDNTGNAGAEALFEMNGGVFRQVGVNGGRNSVRFGANNNEGSKVFHVQHGGVFSCEDLFRVSNDGCEAHFLADGGASIDFQTGLTINGKHETSLAFTNATLRCYGPIKGDSSKSSFYANGLTYTPVFSTANSDMFVNNFKTFELGADGLTVDLAEFSDESNWCCLQELSGVGGLTVTGVGDPRTAIAFRGSPGTFAGGVTVRNAGFAITSNNCASLDVRLYDGGGLINTILSRGEGSLESIVSVKTLTCGADAADTSVLVPMFQAFDTGDGVVPFRVNEALAVNGTVEVAFRLAGQAGRQRPAFTQPQRILIAPKGTIDASKFRLTSDYAGMTATFQVEPFDSARDVLVLGLSGHSHVWQAGSGAWTDAANWTLAPENVAQDPISFPSTLAVDATVTLGGGRTVGQMANASAHDVTLTGGTVALDNGTGRTPTLVSRGGGTLSVPVAAVSSGTLKSEGCIALTHALPAGTTVAHADGILSGTPADLGDGEITVTSGTLRPTADGAIRAAVTGAERGIRVDVPAGVSVSQVGTFTNPKCFLKTGRGEYVMAAPGSMVLSASNSDLNQDKQRYYLPADGSFPTNGLGSAMIAGGIFTFGREGQTLTVNSSEMWVGCHPIVENGDPQDVTVNMMGGALKMGSYLGIGRNKRDENLFKAMTRRPNYTFNQYAGDVDVSAFVMCWDNSFNQRCLATYNLYDGTMLVRNRFGMGHHECRESATAALGLNECVFNVYGGQLTVLKGSETMTIGGQSHAGCGRMNVYGGTVEVQKDVVYVANNGGQGMLHLAGGTFIACILQKSNVSSTATVIWDGGVYKPAANATAIVKDITSNLVAVGGAKIDTSLCTAAKITLNQTLIHDPACAETDGGLAKYGTGVLAVTQPMSFTGPLAAFGGGISLEGASASAVPAVKGCAAITNGTLAVSGYVQPCAEDADTWSAATLEVDSLAFGAGATWKVALNETATEAATLKVNGALTAAEPVPLDFARDAENPLPKTFDVTIATFAQKPESLPRFKGINTGLNSSMQVRTRLVNGVELHAVAQPAGGQIILR